MGNLTSAPSKLLVMVFAISGLILAASTNLTILNYQRLSTACFDGTMKQQDAMCIYQTFPEVLVDILLPRSQCGRIFEKIDGSLEVEPFKN